MLFVGSSIIHPSTEGVFLLCNILDLLIYRYKKKIEWEEFSVIRRYHNHFFFNMSKQKDAGPYWAMFHPFTSFVIFDNSRNRSVHTMPLNADEFCELLTSYGVQYTERK